MFLITFTAVLNVDASISVCSVVIKKIQQKQCVAFVRHVSLLKCVIFHNIVIS
jgi:hypothetical protein